MNKNDIKKWLLSVGISNFKINSDYTVDVEGDVYLDNKNLTYIPIQFGIVDGDFYIYNNKLKSLKGSPKKCCSLFCYNNELENLDGSPEVCDEIHCYNNNLITLKGITNKCEILDCSHNNLISLEGAPKECYHLYCNDNKLVNLEWAPKICTRLVCYNNNIDKTKSMKFVKNIDTIVYTI